MKKSITDFGVGPKFAPPMVSDEVKEKQTVSLNKNNKQNSFF